MLQLLNRVNWFRRNAVKRQDYDSAALWKNVLHKLEHINNLDPVEAKVEFMEFVCQLREFLNASDEVVAELIRREGGGAK